MTHLNNAMLLVHVLIIGLAVIGSHAIPLDPIYQEPPDSPNSEECWKDGDVASEANMEGMFQWAIENGANVSLVEYIPDGHGGWGLVAKTDVPAEETVLDIPVGISIHGDNVTDHPVIGGLFAHAKRVIHYFESDSGSLYGIVLLLHYEMFYNFNQSFWKPFLATFPRTFTTPFYFQGKDAEILGALDQMQKYQETINGHVSFVDIVLQEVISTRPDVYGNISDHTVAQKLKKEISWAASTVFSRAHGPRFDGDKSSLVPVAILMNHDSNSEALGATITGFDSALMELVSFIHTVSTSLKKGDDVLTSYIGDDYSKPDLSLLNTYGFITREESLQCLPVKVKLGEKSDGLILEQFRNQLIRQLDLMQDSEEEFHVCLSDQALSSSLLQVLRLKHLDMEDLRNGASTEFVNLDNEHKALTLIRNAAIEAIDLSDRHRKEAEALLGGQLPSVNQKHLFDVHDGIARAARHNYDLIEKYWSSLLRKDLDGTDNTCKAQA